MFVHIISPLLDWSSLSSFLVIWYPSGNTRGPSVVFEAVDMPCPGPFHFSHIADNIYDFCPLPTCFFSLSLCRCRLLSLGCPYTCVSVFLCTHILFIVLTMMSKLLEFVLSQIPFRNLRTQHTVICCIRDTLAYMYSFLPITRNKLLLF